MFHRAFANRATAMVVFSLLWSSVSVYAQSTAVTSVAPPTTVYDRNPLGKNSEVAEIEPLVDWLPIWGKAAEKKGFDLPLPFGFGFTYTYIHQNMEISDLRIRNRPLGLKIQDAPTTTHTAVFRADAWIFPFLNVYGLVGETAGVTEPKVTFSNGRVLGSDVDYNRFSYGGGLTLAGGWKAYFATLDANYTSGPIVSKAKGQIGDDPIESFTLSPRVGMLFSSGRLGIGSLWVGGMCLIATSKIHDKIDLTGHPRLANLIGEDELRFSIDVKPKEKWNLLIGGNWEINKRWSLTAELGGVMDRFHTIGAVMWRF